jgi:hypothetical protein
MIRRLGPAVGTSLFACLLVLTVAAPASAVTNQWLSVMSAWTQPSTDSRRVWLNARGDGIHTDPGYAAYGFDWSTDYCSQSLDQPLGFDFRMPCARHDFGYRNYRTEPGLLSQHKKHVDDALYFDLKAKCATYSVWVRPSCYSLAWSYYQAISKLNGARVSNADLDKAARLKAQGVAAAAAAGQRA